MRGITFSIDIPDLVLAVLMAILQPCPTEDSSWCSWDAHTRGNRLGESFVDLAGVLLQ